MKNKKIISLLIVAIFICTSLSMAAGAREREAEADKLKFSIKDTGTVFRDDSSKKNPFMIKGDEGITLRGMHFDTYLPINLGPEFSQEGLKVGFNAVVTGWLSPRVLLQCIHFRALPIYISEMWLLGAENGAIKGRVSGSDHSDHFPIPLDDVKIEVFSQNQIDGSIREPLYETITDSAGSYKIADVLPGEYKVVASKEGYKDISKNIKLEPREAKTVDFKLYKMPIGLKFDIQVNEEHIAGDSILVTAALENMGEDSLCLSEMGLIFQSLDFLILTPDEKILHYVGALVDCRPPHIKLNHGEKHTATVDLTDDENPFGEAYGFPPMSYDFSKPGEYEIKGIYNSFKDSCEDEEIGIEMRLESPAHKFTVIGDPIEYFELVLDTQPYITAGEVYTLSPEPIEYKPIKDGKIHAIYEKNTEVEITISDEVEIQDVSYAFEKWLSDAEGDANPLTTVMGQDKSITAVFIESK